MPADASPPPPAEPNEWVRYGMARARLVEDAGSYCVPHVNSGLKGPDFICAGAMKTGTSWLYDVLRRHPAIWLPPIKEISYFTSHYVEKQHDYFRPRRARLVAEARLHWTGVAKEAGGSPSWQGSAADAMLAAIRHLEQDANTDAWYEDIFQFRGADQIAGDISPDYCLLPRVGIRHILRSQPGTKIILMLRDPVERLISHACASVPGLGSVNDLEELIRSAQGREWRAVSDYSGWLPKWIAAVDPARLHITYTRRIGREPHVVLEEICEFLGVPFDPDVFPGAMRKVYESQKPEGVETLIELLRNEMAPQYAAFRRQFPAIAEAIGAGT